MNSRALVLNSFKSSISSNSHFETFFKVCDSKISIHSNLESVHTDICTRLLPYYPMMELLKTTEFEFSLIESDALYAAMVPAAEKELGQWTVSYCTTPEGTVSFDEFEA